MELFLNNLDVAVRDSKEKKGGGDNISVEERVALNEMKRWDNLVVRPYDKGVGFVVDDLENYKERIFTEIHNQQTYEVVENKETVISEIHSRIKDWTEKHKQDSH